MSASVSTAPPAPPQARFPLQADGQPSALFRPAPPLALSGRTIATKAPAFVVGIVNLTGDSFYAESRAGENAELAVEKALRLVGEGADIIDLGAESTRPGADYVDAETERARLLPVIRGIRRVSAVPLSVDTRKPEVLAAALEAGADILNDVSALEDGGAGMARLVAEGGVPVVLMHKRGTPKTMQEAPAYTDVVQEVAAYLAERVRYAVQAGISPEKIILDPGVGFGKNLEQNKALLASPARLLEAVSAACAEAAPRGGSPRHVLVGVSRKNCVGEMTGRPVEKRLAGSLASGMISVLKGATMVRVHDVAETRDLISVMEHFCECV